MIDAGERDRRIKIVPIVLGTDGAGAPKQEQGTAVDVWARKTSMAFNTKYVNDQNQLIADVAFDVPWSENISMPCQVIFEGQTFDVQHIQELRYHEDLKLYCKRAQQVKAL